MAKKILVILSSERWSSAAKIAGVYRYAKKVGWKVQTVTLTSDQRDVDKLLKFWKPDGCIYESGHFGIVSMHKIFASIRTVYLDADRRYLPKSRPAIIHDSEADGRLAAKELLSLGRTSFAFIAYPGDLFWSRDREAAFLKTLRLNGIFRYERLHPTATIDDDISLTKEISRFVNSLPSGCGIFAANDFIASKVLSVCQRFHRQVPEDLAVLGIDNDEPICTRALPTLSSIAPDFELGGYRAAELLDELFHGKHAPGNRTFGPITVVRRASTASPSAYRGLSLRIVKLIRNAEGCTTPAKIFSELKCSRRTAELHFHKATGKSVLEAITEVRFESACLLLRQRLLPTATIARRVGYESAAAFDRFFKSRTGVSPTKWRNWHSPSIGISAL